MQITLNRGELREAVSGFSKIVNGKTTLPILGCVRFASNGKGITAQVTDLDQHLSFTFGNAQAQGEGAIVVPLASLKEMAKGNTDETLVFETGADNTVVVTNHVGAHAVRHPLNGMDGEEWPSMPPAADTKPATGFLDTYRRLVPFASTDTTRHVLNSVYVEVAEKGEHPVTMVATDGRRLSLWNTMNLPLEKSVIVPTTRFLLWTGVQAGEEQLGLRTTRVKKETQVQGVTLRAGPWTYDTRHIDGSYPNFRQVVPNAQDAANRITFTDEDVGALKKILPTFPGAGAHDAGIKLLAASGDKLIIAGRGTDDKTDTTLELTA